MDDNEVHDWADWVDDDRDMSKARGGAWRYVGAKVEAGEKLVTVGPSSIDTSNGWSITPLESTRGLVSTIPGKLDLRRWIDAADGRLMCTSGRDTRRGVPTEDVEWTDAVSDR